MSRLLHKKKINTDSILFNRNYPIVFVYPPSIRIKQTLRTYCPFLKDLDEWTEVFVSQNKDDNFYDFYGGWFIKKNKRNDPILQCAGFAPTLPVARTTHHTIPLVQTQKHSQFISIDTLTRGESVEASDTTPAATRWASTTWKICEELRHWLQ